MATRKRLTDAGIQRLGRPTAGTRIELWDRDVPGFGLRITPSARAWQVVYRFAGRPRRSTIGYYFSTEEYEALPEGQRGDALGLAEARTKARLYRKQAKAGVDPEEVERAAREAQTKVAGDTFAVVRQQFVDSHLSKLRTGRMVERYLRDDLVAWDDRPIRSIGKRDIIQAIEQKARTGGGHASNRLRSHLMKMLRWAAARDIVDSIPVVMIERAPEPPRERVLEPGEIAQLWAAWDTLGWPYGAMLQAALTTGQRRGEVAAMKWRSIHAVPLGEGMSPEGHPFTVVGWTWELAAGETKSARAHSVPLSDLVLVVLAGVPRTTSAYVFPAPLRGNRDTYAADFDRAKERSLQLCPGVVGWRIHDLRRTAASMMTQLGIPVHIVGRVLNHSNGGSTTSRHYDRYQYGPEMRGALDTWAKQLSAIIGRPAPKSAVVDLAAARAGRGK
jgi:integrase